MGIVNARLKENQFDFIHDGRRAFRTLMMSLAFPGVIHKLDPVPLVIKPTAIGFILQPFLTLLDLEVTFYVHAMEDDVRKEVSRYIEINTRSISANLDRADFVLCLSPSLNGKFETVKQGSLPNPHKSATVFYIVKKITDHPHGGDVGLYLTGPGIRSKQVLYIDGMDPDEPKQWRQNRTQYPMGADIYLVSHSGKIIGIPRSVEITPDFCNIGVKTLGDK
jgi:alpha-D-ribose 1-methylphosphonate 5-triphosphate synthase subunit PhnH